MSFVLASGADGPHDPGVEARLTKLEADMAIVKSDVAVIRSNYATREYLHQEINSQTWKVVGWVTTVSFALTGAVYFIAKHV